MRFVAAALIAVALTGAASAQSVETVEIAFRPSDLSNVERLDALRDRIRLAALNVCDARSARTLAEQRAARECVAEARRASEAQLNIAVARVNGVVEVAAVVR
ncbi:MULTISPECIES: UrcA family protein [unclassified Oceanicaulis]|jgi:UrcA family protein|uniref:UrcA family protein n=1 Tax=unclassified Oceanicaulis TaxID=2632123 RepID=UPI0025EAB51F|nr:MULTISPECIES: UrcA family protein [unclassified Oceanicaulis]|tara:strand:- start:1916 stop:2224 length:309 start_codon:yes stop_codon:yes gene_type:complete